MKPLRINYVIYGSLGQATGGYTYDRCVISGLRAQGDEVRVISLLPGAKRLVPELRSCLRDSETDVVVADELCHREISALFWVSKALQVRAVPTPARVLLVHHLTQWEGANSIPSERRAVLRADVAIATSECNARRLITEFGVPACACIPGADRLLLKPRQKRGAGPLRLLFAGTWTARKGLRELLLALVAEQHFQLTIVGDQTRDAAYSAEVAQLLTHYPHLAQRCQVLGIVSDEQLASIYAAHDVLVLPSQYEGYGMVLSEASRAGLGVIAFNTGGTPEAVAYAPISELVEPDGDMALRATLQRWIIQREEIRFRLDHPEAEREMPLWDNTVVKFRSALNAALKAH